MRVIFIIGGMGAGKSTVRKALGNLGLPCIDFDAIGHSVLERDDVKADLAHAFGADILDETNTVIRSLLATRAFADETSTKLLNSITMPRIREAYEDQIAQLESEGYPAAIVETSVFAGREDWMVREGDIVLAVCAPEELRVARTVAAGWNEDDVRRRIAQQATDEERIAAADVVFQNVGTPEELCRAIAEWWGDQGAQ